MKKIVLGLCLFSSTAFASPMIHSMQLGSAPTTTNSAIIYNVSNAQGLTDPNVTITEMGIDAYSSGNNANACNLGTPLTVYNYSPGSITQSTNGTTEYGLDSSGVYSALAASTDMTEVHCIYFFESGTEGQTTVTTETYAAVNCNDQANPNKCIVNDTSPLSLQLSPDEQKGSAHE